MRRCLGLSIPDAAGRDGRSRSYESKAFDGPAARVFFFLFLSFIFTGIFQVCGQHLDHTLGLNPAVAEQAERPQGPNLFLVIAGVGLPHQGIDSGLGLGESIRGELHFDSGGAYALVVGIQCDRGEVSELLIPLESASPGIDARFDLGFDQIWISVRMAHGTLKQ